MGKIKIIPFVVKICSYPVIAHCQFLGGCQDQVQFGIDVM